MKFIPAFTLDTSGIKFGPGVTREAGQDMQQLGANRIMAVTDQNLAATLRHQLVTATCKRRRFEKLFLNSMTLS